MLELTKHGFSREKAYTIVQKNAQNSWKKNISFYKSLANDALINKKISNKELSKMFDLNYHIKRINIIFKRIFKQV
jgi:adenylosuccinate lyase